MPPSSCVGRTAQSLLATIPASPEAPSAWPPCEVPNGPTATIPPLLTRSTSSSGPLAGEVRRRPYESLWPSRSEMIATAHTRRRLPYRQRACIAGGTRHDSRMPRAEIAPPPSPRPTDAYRRLIAFPGASSPRSPRRGAGPRRPRCGNRHGMIFRTRLVVAAAGSARRGPRDRRRPAREEPDRCLRTRSPQEGEARPRAADRSPHPHPSADVRSHRSAPDAARGRGVRRRCVSRRLRAARRSAPRLASLRRTLGAPLARRRPLRRKPGVRAERLSPERVEVSRLRRRGVQLRHAVRPVRSPADRRRRPRAR